MNLLPQLAATGLFMLVVLLVAACCLRILVLLALRRLTRQDYLRRPWLDRPVVRAVILALGLIGACCFLYAWRVEPFRLNATLEALSMPLLPGGGRIRIVHLSDLHIDEDGQPVAGLGMALGAAPGGSGGPEVGLADLVNAQTPDLVLMTGDYLNTSAPEAEATLRRLLRSLHPRHGIYAVLGNWDYRSWSRARAILAEEGVQVISSAKAEVIIQGTHIRLLGDTLPARPAIPPESGAKRAWTVFLTHTPDQVEDVAGKVDLYLCGHTHGGQIRLPFFGALLTLSRFWKRYEMGRYEVGGTTLFVNRGIGCEGGPTPRVRFLSPPEILVIDLVGESPTLR